MTVQELLTLSEEMAQGFHDHTKDGKCSGCGDCCGKWLPVTKKEIERIRRYIKENQIPVQNNADPTACPFRSEAEGKCLVYPVRPAICRDFRCDKPAKNIPARAHLYHGKIIIYDMRAAFCGKEAQE